LPLFAKEGNCLSLWQREVRRDFINFPIIYGLINMQLPGIRTVEGELKNEDK
jgi:hypothetical protein